VAVSADVPRLAPLAQARLASALAAAGEADEAVTLAREVLEVEPEGERAAVAALALAQAGYQRGDPDVMREHAETAIQLARRASLPSVQADALHVLGWAHMWTGPGAAAEETWGETARVALQAGDTVLAARASSSRAISAATELNLGDAERWSSEAMTLAETSGSMHALMWAHIAKARTREFQGSSLR
jgi:tetratricopeptide (TPR) repeat protein